MTKISSYVDYLPSVLWSKEIDSSQFLGRMLCIFEKILTGIDAQVIRARATISNADGNKIQVTDSAAAAIFRAGDIISIEDTMEQAVIDHVQDSEILLCNELTHQYTGGTILICDLKPGQTTFRVDNIAGLEQGSSIKITRGTKSEDKTIQKVTGDFITLSAGLVNTYSMGSTDEPVKIQKIPGGNNIGAQALRARATIVNNTIEVTNNTEAAQFRPGDIINIEGTEDQFIIDCIHEARIFLNGNNNQNTSGDIRISDLKPNQTTFRVDNVAGLEQGSTLKITQGTKSEDKNIQKVTDNFITLSDGLKNTYSMGSTDEPVNIEKPDGSTTQAIRARATIVNNAIEVAATEEAKFQIGDFIGLEGTEDRFEIDYINGTRIFLKDLNGQYTSGNIHICNLKTDQTTFRVDNVAGLEQGSSIKITQATKSEDKNIQKVTDNFITLSDGLKNTYSMGSTDEPVNIEKPDGSTTQATRARATIVNNTIQVTNNNAAAKFRAKDIISIEGTLERAGIDQIEGSVIFLDSNLENSHTSGNIRICDLKTNQTIFRVDNVAAFEHGSSIKITQGTKSEDKTIQEITDNFIILSDGLLNTYSMSNTEDPVEILNGVSGIYRTNAHDDFEKIIDELSRTFNPWKTNFLPWLASWVALTLQKDWNEYQQRKLISEIVSIYQVSGLKKGMHDYLDIYSVTEARPRIAIDNGDAIFRAKFLDNGTATLHTVAQSNAISQKDNLMTILLHPSAIASDNDNSYIVADKGSTYMSKPQKPSLWKLSSMGDIDYKYTAGTPPMPNPICLGDPLKVPVAVVVDRKNRYSVLDIGSISDDSSPHSAIYRFDPKETSNTPETVIANSTIPPFPAVYPVDMILDGSENESFVVLDQGSRLDGENKNIAEPKIIVVTEGPLNVTPHTLTKVINPTALTIDSKGCYIVADAKSESTTVPADIVMIDPNSDWSETSLLGAVPPENNPLIFPTGLVFENPKSLYVCDLGIREGSSGDSTYDITNITMAEPAAIYRIDLSKTPPTITRVTYEKKLVFPTKIMFDRKGKLIITDQGESGEVQQRDWRAEVNEFGIVVLFSQQRPTSVEDRNRIRLEIESIVDGQKPADTLFWMKY